MHNLKKMLSIALCAALIVTSLVTVAGAKSSSVTDGRFVFDSADMLSYINTAASHNVNISYDTTEHAVKLVVNSTASDPDPYALFDFSSVSPALSADEYKYIVVTYRSPSSTSSKATTTELFLSAGATAGPTGGCSISYLVTKGSTYASKIVDVSSSSWWNGNIHSIRFDCYTAATFGDTIYIDSIVFARNTTEATAIKNDRLSAAYAEDLTKQTSDSVLTKYDYEKYTSPVWKGNIVYNEAVYPIQDKNGNSVYTLMYTPDEIKSVYNATFSSKYTEGVDFTVSGNKLTILQSGTIATRSYSSIHLSSNPGGSYYYRKAAGGGYEYWGQSSEFFGGYLNITYTHSDGWNGYVPQNESSDMPKTAAAIASNSDMNIVYFGDSICGGANSSSYRNLYPYAPYWNEQITEYLEKSLGCTNIKPYYNCVGGSDATGMLPQLQSSVIDYAPDLVFIEYGMNDAMNASQSSSSSASKLKSEYKSAIEQMITGVRAQYPNCEFVLVAPFYGNIYCHYQSYFDACAEALNELSAKYTGVVTADVTAMHRYLITFKDYLDCSGDNMCHPNDFMSRIYAQICLESFVPGGVAAYVPTEEPLTTAMNEVAKAAPAGSGRYWTNAEAYGIMSGYGKNGQDLELSFDLCLLPDSKDTSSAALYTKQGGNITITPTYVQFGSRKMCSNWGNPSWKNWHRVTIAVHDGTVSVYIDGDKCAYFQKSTNASSQIILYTDYQMLFSQTGSMAIDNISMCSGTGTQYFNCDFENASETSALFDGSLGAVTALDANTVSYNANGGLGAPVSQLKITSYPLILTDKVPTREGYIFKGWSESAGGAVSYQSGGTYSGNSATTLYAVWQSETPPLEITSVTPLSAGVSDTGSASYTVEATGKGSLTYSWSTVTANAAATLSGTDSKALTVTVSKQQHEGFTATYKCTVTDEAGQSAEAATVSFVYTTTYTEKPAYILGDLNNDELINGKDANLLIKINCAELDAPAGSELFLAADINSDGILNAKDANILTRYLCGDLLHL